MLLEYETASIIKFLLDSADNPAPYYSEVKENFIVPCVYFPSPEIDSDGDTLTSFKLRYRWNIKVFHKTTEEAYSIAHAVLTAFKAAHNLVPVIDEEGQETDHFLRIIDPEIKRLDSGVYLVAIQWDSRRPYGDPEVNLTQEFIFNGLPVYVEPVLSQEDIEEAENNADPKT